MLFRSDRTIAVNLKSCFNYIQPCVTHMRQAGHGRIVSMSSLNAHSGGVTSAVSKFSYAAAKAGIIGFTRAVSLELKDTGVRINCFGPGATDTPLWRVGKSEADVQKLLDAGYVYQPDEFSNVVVWLASDFSAPLNGEFISRDLHR